MNPTLEKCQPVLAAYAEALKSKHLIHFEVSVIITGIIRFAFDRLNTLW